ncbi:hypothetical protein QR680_009272 [Steinernema hermaphroditum]|uniref:DUF4604 domain-containing protein n=1 Tax=Steinernema hermaphroditum TaxID=289476 RepID=A0AA39M9E1_9BILA|nr:hypothetical protein QR680_009272 [Steinernema hermaphroditum]
MDKKLNYKQKQSIAWVDKGDPPFLQKVKAQLGYQEGSKLEDKLASTSSAHFNEDDREEDDILQLKEEDRPQIVVLNPESDLSQKEFDKEAKKRAEEEDSEKADRRRQNHVQEAGTEERGQRRRERRGGFGEEEIEAGEGRLAAQCSTPCAMCGWTEEADAPEEELTLKGSELVIFGVVYSFTVLLLVVVFELVMPVVDNPDYPFYNKMPDYRFQRPSPHLI